MRLEILDEHHFLESPLFTHSWDLFKQEQSSIISTRNITPISQFADSIRKVDTCHDRLYYQHVPTQDVSQAIQSNKGDMKYYELNIFLCHIGNTILQQYGTQDSKVACLFLELLIVDSNTMRHINKEYRQKNYATDVLSFPLEILAIHEEQCLGSIVLNIHKVINKANFYNHNVYAEITLLFIHAFLHILGFNHECDNGEHREAEKMIVELFCLPQSLIIRNE